MVVAQILYRPIIQVFTGMTDIQFTVNFVYLVGSVVFAILLQMVFVLKTIIATSRRDVMENVFNKVSTVVKSKLSHFIVGAVFLVVAFVLYYLNGTYNFSLAAIELVLGLIGEALVIGTLSDFLNFVFAKVFRQRYMHMGIRNINKSSSAVSNVKLITMSLAIVYVVYIASNSLGTYFERALVSQVGNDYVVSGLSEAFDEYEVFEDELVTDNIASYTVSGTVKVNKISYSGVTVTGMDKAILGVEDKSNVISGLKPGEVAVDGLFMTKFGYKVGDQVDLSSDLFKNTDDVKMTIAGEVETGAFNTNRNTIVFCQEDFFEYITDVPNMVLIAVKDDSVESHEKVEKLFNDANLFLTLTEDYIKTQEDSVNQVLDLLNVLIGLTLFLVFIGIISNQLVGFIQRKKEFAVLISVALSVKQMRRVMINEVLFNALIGAILGTIDGLLLCVFLEQIMYAIGIAVPIIVDPQKVGMLFGFVVLLILLTAVLPIMNLRKLDIIEEIKNE
ncbi:MAG: FtsX-like permease family protein [Firmicutes bacterium ADurb.Bin419]|nr:MAG: FtsX-like permease family protein [Firmicutes bacterium ADurb.Bin419]